MIRRPSLGRANVRQLSLTCGPDISGVDCGNRKRIPLHRNELQRVASPAAVDRHDCADVSCDEAMLRQVSRQYDLIMLIDHASVTFTRGTIVISRGAVASLSSTQTVRTDGLRPSGLGSAPSISNIMPKSV